LGSKSPQEMMILHIQSWYMKEMNLSPIQAPNIWMAKKKKKKDNKKKNYGII
jgi:hypothetical protein